MFVHKAAVVGAGTMGGEIAQVIAAAEIPVLLKDIDPALIDAGLERARAVTSAHLERLVRKQKLTPEQAEAQLQTVLGRIAGTTSYDGFGEVDFVIEAVPERLEVKRAVFEELDAVTPGQAVLASNTSSLSVTEMAQATHRPERVVGFHFFYPAAMMRLVEIVEGDETSWQTTATAVSFAQTIRKVPITCAEVPGFVVNRILNSAASEIWREQELQGLDVQALDRSVGEARVAPTGPFFLADLLGLDTVLRVAEHLHACYGDRFYVHRGMRELVAAGHLGQKTGRGFYEHAG